MGPEHPCCLPFHSPLPHKLPFTAQVGVQAGRKVLGGKGELGGHAWGLGQIKDTPQRT